MQRKSIKEINVVKLSNLLKEGYQKMAIESRKVMHDFEFLDRESLKYIDKQMARKKDWR